MVVLDGRKIANNILLQLKAEIAQLPFQPVFCDVLVGGDAVSFSYVKIKGRTAEQIGLKFLIEQLPENILQESLIKKISELNNIQNMCGLIVQLPLPPGLDRQAVLDAIKPELDVDCLGKRGSDFATNFAKASDFVKTTSDKSSVKKASSDKQSPLIPPTSAAVLALVDELPDNLKSGQFVIVGQGQLVGKPVSFLLKQRNYKVTVADRTTPNLSILTKTADVLISGTGRANLITADFVKPGAAVIDAGTAEMDGGIVGDVDFESVKNVAGYLTPVPGGVGPLTVAMLLKNVLEVAKQLKVSSYQV